jgi:tripartite-type tricarboxylate transporter receptor subunit TctC
MRSLCFAFFCIAWCAGAAGAAHAAQGWPTKPVRLLVPFAPGGATDIVARILAPALSERLGQQFIVDNRAGAAGNIAVEIAARAQPDGHTILINNVSTGAINPTGFRAVLKFDPAQELTGVILLASIPNVMVSGMAFPPNTLKELVEYTRARPSQMNYSNPVGAYSHLDMLDFSKRTGMQALNVPSKGAGSSIASIIAGEIHYSFLNAATVTPQIRAGRLKAFATTAQQRLPDLAEVPTMAEAGYPGVGSVNWNGLFVPAKTPRAVIDRLHAATTEVMQRPEIRGAFDKARVPVTLSQSPAEFQAFVNAEIRRWARILAENDVRLH